MTAKHGIRFETFIDQFPKKLEKALPGFRIIRAQGDELEYEYDGFDNALDLRIVHDKFLQSRVDLGGMVERYADYVRQFASQSRQPQPAAAAAVKHYDGYSEKEADWFQKAAAEQRQRLNAYAPPPPPPPVSAPSNRHPNVIKVKTRRRQPEQPISVPPPALRPAPAPVVARPASAAKPAVKMKKVSKPAKKSAARPKRTGARVKAKPAAKASAKRAATARPRAAARPTARKKIAARPRFMDRVKKLFGRR